MGVLEEQNEVRLLRLTSVWLLKGIKKLKQLNVPHTTKKLAAVVDCQNELTVGDTKEKQM